MKNWISKTSIKDIEEFNDDLVHQYRKHTLLRIICVVDYKISINMTNTQPQAVDINYI